MQDELSSQLRAAVSGGWDRAGTMVAQALAVGSRIRGGKVVHPDGVAYSACLRIDGGGQIAQASRLLSRRAELPAIVRFSRSVGLPRPLPDLLGMAIRVIDAYGEDEHQDFLMVTSVDLPILHHIFLPATDAQQRPYSSSLAYRSGSETFIVGARSAASSPRPDGDDEFDRLDKAARSGELRFELMVAAVLGRFCRVGELEIGAKLPAESNALRFNPFHTGPGLEPVGIFNHWRREAYPRSQKAWRSSGRGQLQDRAEALVRSQAPGGHGTNGSEPRNTAPAGPMSAGASRPDAFNN